MLSRPGRRQTQERPQARPRQARGSPDLTLLLGALVLAVGAGLTLAQDNDPGDSGAVAPGASTPAARGTSSASPSPSAKSSPRPSPTPTPTPTPPPSPTPRPAARLRLVGDVMLARTIGERIERDGPATVFGRVADQLADADVTVANLECAISQRGERAAKAYTFRAPPAGAAALAGAGIDVVSLANNHAVDYGRAALVDTLEYLDGEGVVPVGGGRDRDAARAPAVVTVNGLRIAFLSYAGRMVERSGWRTTDGEATATEAGIAIGRPDDVAADVRSAREHADVVVLLMHAGIEGSAVPAPVQQDIARAALDAGAALVVGHHPHVLQGTWHDDGRLVAWSLGNFVFDGFEGLYGGRATDSAILEVTLAPSGVESFDWLPVVVFEGLPRPASEAQAARVGSQIGATQAP